MHPTLQFPGAPRLFFATKADYLAYRAAWRRLVASRRPLAAGHYAAHALLSGRDLYKVFGRNIRGRGQAPYGALAVALNDVMAPRSADLRLAWTFADLEVPAALEALQRALHEAGFTSLGLYGRDTGLVAQGQFSLENAPRAVAAAFEEKAHG